MVPVAVSAIRLASIREAVISLVTLRLSTLLISLPVSRAILARLGYYILS